MKSRPSKRPRLQQEARVGLLFLSPWLIGFVFLKALPILAALYRVRKLHPLFQGYQRRSEPLWFAQLLPADCAAGNDRCTGLLGKESGL